MENYTHLRTAAKASKSLLVRLNFFYTEGSLEGIADQKVENYCLMGGSTGAWKHSRDARYLVGLDDLENLFQPWWFYNAARVVPNQPVLCFTHGSMISVQTKAESHHCQKSLTASSKTQFGTQSTIPVLLFFCRSFPGNPRIKIKIQQRTSTENFKISMLQFASNFVSNLTRQETWKTLNSDAKILCTKQGAALGWTGYAQEHGLNLAPFQRFKMSISIDWRSKAWNNCSVADYFMHSSE